MISQIIAIYHGQLNPRMALTDGTVDMDLSSISYPEFKDEMIEYVLELISNSERGPASSSLSLIYQPHKDEKSIITAGIRASQRRP